VAVGPGIAPSPSLRSLAAPRDRFTQAQTYAFRRVIHGHMRFPLKRRGGCHQHHAPLRLAIMAGRSIASARQGDHVEPEEFRNLDGSDLIEASGCAESRVVDQCLDSAQPILATTSAAAPACPSPPDDGRLRAHLLEFTRQSPHRSVRRAIKSDRVRRERLARQIRADSADAPVTTRSVYSSQFLLGEGSIP